MSSLWERLQRKVFRTVYVGWLRARGRTMSFEDPRGPIQRASWATFLIDGQEHSDGDRVVGAGKDLRIVGGEVSSWSERQGHRLNVSMITGVFDRQLELLILGLGFDRQVACPPELIGEIKTRGIPEVMTVDTAEACRLFNDLTRAGKRVGMLVHGTC